MATINTSGTGLNICNDTAYQNSVLLKQRFQLKNIPPQRYDNLVNNPYISNPQYTQKDFDMRRKAEILKYSASKTNTKTNNLTKAEKWRLIVNGSTKQVSQSFIQLNTISQIIDPISNLKSSITIQTCPSGTIITTPSYASGIPGPLTQLYLDPSVPLYNYATGQDPYAILNSSPNEFTYDYGLNQYDNLLFASPANSIMATSIYIENPINEYRDFNITFPISMFIKGTVKSDISNSHISYNSSNNNEYYGENYVNGTNQYDLPITVKFSKPVSCTVQYGDVPLQNIAYDITLSNPDIESNTNLKSVRFDISMVPNYNDPNNNSFYVNQILGFCTINNFRILDKNGNIIQRGLTTKSGYIYDIYLNTLDSLGESLYIVDGIYPFYNYIKPDKPNDKNRSSYSNFFNDPTYGIYVNISKLKANEVFNSFAYRSYTYPPPSSLYPITIT